MSSTPASLGRLLVVDDETTLVTALLSTLRDSGYVAVGAANPFDALEVLRNERFDALITDLHLPEMDGIELIRAALKIDPTLSVIMMTGHGTIDTAVDAMKAGAMDYVLKPFKLKTVLAALSRVLEIRQLREANEALNRQLAARTRELEAVNVELEAFSYSVSHDLRSPLRAIEGFTEAMIDEFSNGDKVQAAEYGERIRWGVRRMGTMIDDLLRLARAMRSQLKMSKVDLTVMAAEIMEKLQAEEPSRKRELHIAPNMAVVGDPGLLRVALENLLSNAWKYTGKCAVARVEMGTEESLEGGVYFVRDNGVGFDPAEAERLFSPFERLSSAHGFEGTGIGLATVKRIILRHGGRVWATSQLGTETTFFFTVPPPPSAHDRRPASVTPPSS